MEEVQKKAERLFDTLTGQMRGQLTRFAEATVEADPDDLAETVDQLTGELHEWLDENVSEIILGEDEDADDEEEED